MRFSCRTERGGWNGEIPMGTASDTTYPYYSLSFVWRGGRMREHADGEVEKRKRPLSRQQVADSSP